MSTERPRELSWRVSDTLQVDEIFEEDGKTFRVLYVNPEIQGPTFGKPGVPNEQRLPRKVRVMEL